MIVTDFGKAKRKRKLFPRDEKQRCNNMAPASDLSNGHLLRTKDNTAGTHGAPKGEKGSFTAWVLAARDLSHHHSFFVRVWRQHIFLSQFALWSTWPRQACNTSDTKLNTMGTQRCYVLEVHTAPNSHVSSRFSQIRGLPLLPGT